jgi:hypothetical protein
MVLRRRGLNRPRDAPLLSWEVWLGALARWPYVAWGVLSATAQKVRPRPVSFKVTPKSRDGLEPLATRTIVPYLLITLVTAGAAIAGEHRTHAAGYVFLCLVAGVSYTVVALAVSLLHAHEAARAAGVAYGAALRGAARAPLAASVVTALPLLVALAQFPSYASRAFGW